jgi:hypothetical protein
MDILVRENFFLQNKINALTTQLEKIKTDLLYKEQSLQKQHLIKSMYTLDGIINNGSLGATIDTLYGIATLPDSDRLSKLSYTTDDGQVILPSSLAVTLSESNNTQAIDQTTGLPTYYKPEDVKLLRAVDRSNNTFWAHTSSFAEESNVSEVYGIIHVKLPLTMLNNIFANILTLHPYPEYSMTIADIQYKGYGDTWYRLPNFPIEKDQNNNDKPIPIKDAGKLMFSFPKIEVTEIQIFFTQPYWFYNQGKRDFVYGFQDIGLEYRVYNSDVAEFVTEFSIEGTKKRFFTIETPTVSAAQGAESSIDDLVEHKLYYNKAMTNEFDFGNEILAPIQKIYVKTILKKQGDIIPTIRNIKIDYTYKNLDDL